jgi:energy-coupling factor transport system ATP-binding protein
VLECRDVSFSYPGGRQVLSGVSLGLERGTTLGVMGGNGSGKTTLAHLLCGLLTPASGSVLVEGLSTADSSAVYEVRRRVGIVFQDPDDQLIETTVEREIGFGPRNLGLEASDVRARVESAISVFGIDHLRRRPCHLLSAGEKQTVTVASIFAMEPAYVILDESTSLLDTSSRRHLVQAVGRLVKTTGAGLVFISMRLEDTWMCDRTVFLKDGSVAFECPRQQLLGRLVAEAPDLPGLGYMLARLENDLPGLQARTAYDKNLSADSIYRVIREMISRLPGGAAWR